MQTTSLGRLCSMHHALHIRTWLWMEGRLPPAAHTTGGVWFFCKCVFGGGNSVFHHVSVLSGLCLLSFSIKCVGVGVERKTVNMGFWSFVITEFFYTYTQSYHCFSPRSSPGGAGVVGEYSHHRPSSFPLRGVGANVPLWPSSDILCTGR
jgi:hypothetical protein